MINRLAPSFERPALPASAQWTVPLEVLGEQQIEFSWVGETSRHVGTIVHHWLQQIAQHQLQGWNEARVDALTAGFARDLQRRGLQRKDAETAAEQVANALKNALADDRGRWLLGPHPEAATEYRLRVRHQGRLRTYVIDRLLRDAAGTRWIVDFKTSRHEGAGVEQFLDVLPALGVARTFSVGVGQLIDEDEPRPSQQCGVEVELAQCHAAIGYFP